MVDYFEFDFLTNDSAGYVGKVLLIAGGPTKAWIDDVSFTGSEIQSERQV